MTDSKTEHPTNAMTVLTLGSYADSDFTQWVDWARGFNLNLENSCLNGEEKYIVRRVLNMEEVH